MPGFEKLSEAEVQKLGKRQTVIDLTEYENFLKTLKIGEWGRITLGDDEQTRTVKRRMTTAIHKLGSGVKYRKSAEGQLLFQLQAEPVRQNRGPKRGK